MEVLLFAAIAVALKTQRIPRKEPTNPSLPTEIIADIFSRLPAKFVLQMECLSKHYSSSLSKDPYFVEAHFRQSSSLRSSLIVQKPNGIVSLIRSNGDKVTVEKLTLPPKIDYPYWHKNFKIVASCNGIVLLVVGHGCSLWNPATRTFLDLPSRPFFSKAISWGFGYCNQSHDYKVIRIAGSMLNRHKPKFSAEVICINTNRVWRSIDFNCLYINNIEHGISINGFVYWGPTRVGLGKYTILTFDLAKEKFAEIPCPVKGELMVFKGSLAIFDSQTRCSHWVLKDQRDVNLDSWMLHCVFGFFHMFFGFYRRPVGFLNDHQLLVQDRLPLETDEDLEQEERRYECFLYDSYTNEIKKIPDLFAYGREEAHYNFTESLVALMA